MKIRSYQIQSLKDLTVENNKIYLQGNTKKIKIDIPKSMLEKEDWENLMRQIKTDT